MCDLMLLLPNDNEVICHNFFISNVHRHYTCVEKYRISMIIRYIENTHLTAMTRLNLPFATKI